MNFSRGTERITIFYSGTQGKVSSSDLRRAAGAERLPDGRRRLHFAGPIGGDGPSIRICIRDWNLNAEWADSPNRKQAVNSEAVQWATVVAGLASSSYQGGQATLRATPFTETGAARVV